jgi:pyridoxine/pyridoxamine 5'-phosphate oxidase
MSLDDLQQVIDESIANASAFTRGLFQDNHWDAARLQEYSNEDGSMTVATVTRDGKPHAVTVIAACVDGNFYFTASPGSLLLRNLQRDPAVAFTIADKVMGRGTAELAGAAKDLGHLRPQASRTLGALIDEGWEGSVYSIRLESVFAQSS